MPVRIGFVDTSTDSGAAASVTGAGSSWARQLDATKRTADPIETNKNESFFIPLISEWRRIRARGPKAEWKSHQSRLEKCKKKNERLGLETQ